MTPFEVFTKDAVLETDNYRFKIPKPEMIFLRGQVHSPIVSMIVSMTVSTTVSMIVPIVSIVSRTLSLHSVS